MTELLLNDNTRIWYERVGTGPELLQIHGSAFGHSNFALLTPFLERHFSVIDFDLPGFGLSDRPEPGRDIDGFADDVAEIIRSVASGPVHIHGTSMGALIGLTVAARHPDVVDRLILSCFLARYDAAARAMRGTWKEAARASGMAAVADLTAVAGFSREFFERQEVVEAQLVRMRAAFSQSSPASFITATEAIEKLDLSSLVNTIQSPTLLLAGAEDQMTPVSPGGSGVGVAAIHSTLPESQLIVLPACGHYLVIEQPKAASHHITEFINS